MKTNLSLRFVCILAVSSVFLAFLASCSTLDISSAADIDYDSECGDDYEPDEDYPEDVDAESSQVEYKTLRLNDIKITIDVPSGWELFTRRQGGEIYYFIGTIEEWFEFDYSQVPVFSEFYSDSRAMHGVRIQTMHGTIENIDLELRVNTPQYPVVSRSDLADGSVIGTSVLMKDDLKGYYQYYAIGGTSRPGFKLEIRSRLFRNEYDEIVFNAEQDVQEIETIIRSVIYN